MAFRPKLIPTVFTIPAVLTMIFLGHWQLDRLAWKRDLIDRLEARHKAQPVVLPNGNLTRRKDEFRPVVMIGRFDHEGEILLQNRTYEKKAGMHVLTPFILEGGKGSILVDRGWVPFDQSGPEYRQGANKKNRVRLAGMVRFPVEQTAFVPDNVPQKDLWYFVDLDAMGQKTGHAFAPYYVMAGPSGEVGLPVGGRGHVRLSNNHLQYALTWFGLAFVLIVIFLLYHRKKKPVADMEE